MFYNRDRKQQKDILKMNLEILTHGWYDLWTQYTLFYAIFFFAPLIGVYAAYLWRLEHRGHNWNLIMTAPVRPSCLYFAKFCVVTKMAVLTQLWLLVLFAIGGKFGAGLAGSPPPEILLWLLRGVIGGLAIIALQLLLSMVIRNFALPVLIALGGSVVGLLAASENLGAVLALFSHDHGHELQPHRGCDNWWNLGLSSKLYRLFDCISPECQCPADEAGCGGIIPCNLSNSRYTGS